MLTERVNSYRSDKHEQLAEQKQKLAQQLTITTTLSPHK